MTPQHPRPPHPSPYAFAEGLNDNPVENAIRPSALGKKNYLFLGSSDSGHWAATFYSLIGSCLRRKVNPRDYLHWLFTKLPTISAPRVLRSPPSPDAR
jgi:hypothetical protein